MFALLLAASVGQPGHEPAVPPLFAAVRDLRHTGSTAGWRVSAVRDLAGTDCRRHPAAEATLIHALRCDRDECVRYEAARALARGCCCTPAVTLALSHCVTCSDTDGAAWECSGRVRAMAVTALEKCLASRCCAELPPLLPPTELPPSVSYRDRPKEYYAKVPLVPQGQIAASAAWSLEIGRRIGFATTPAATSGEQHRTATNLSDLFVEPRSESRVAKAEPPVAAVRQAAYVAPQAVYRTGGVPAEPVAVGRSTLYPTTATNPYRYR